jgi:hypothetical protein
MSRQQMRGLREQIVSARDNSDKSGLPLET